MTSSSNSRVICVRCAAERAHLYYPRRPRHVTSPLSRHRAGCAIGRLGFGAGYASLSGSTLTPLVTFSGYFPPLGKLISTKKAVHPSGGAGTRAVHVFGPDGVSAVGLYAAPIRSSLKFRADGFTACHSVTSLGRSFATTLMDPSRSNVHRTCGRGVAVTMAV